MKSYTFYTIHTVIDIGDGSTSSVENGSFTNLARLVEGIMLYSYPMMVSIHKTNIDLQDSLNSTFYDLPKTWGNVCISTFKFTLDKDVDLNVDGIPLVLPTIIKNNRITKFHSTGVDKNISIQKQTFSME